MYVRKQNERDVLVRIGSRKNTGQMERSNILAIQLKITIWFYNAKMFHAKMILISYEKHLPMFRLFPNLFFKVVVNV